MLYAALEGQVSDKIRKIFFAFAGFGAYYLLPLKVPGVECFLVFSENLIIGAADWVFSQQQQHRMFRI